MNKTNKPNDVELRKLKTLEKSWKYMILVILSLTALVIIATIFMGSYSDILYPVQGFYTLLILAALIYHAFFKHCPRCRSWITAAKGQYPACLLYLDPNNAENISKYCTSHLICTGNLGCYSVAVAKNDRYIRLEKLFRDGDDEHS